MGWGGPGRSRQRVQRGQPPTGRAALRTLCDTSVVPVRPRYAQPAASSRAPRSAAGRSQQSRQTDSGRGFRPNTVQRNTEAARTTGGVGIELAANVRSPCRSSGQCALQAGSIGGEPCYPWAMAPKFRRAARWLPSRFDALCREPAINLECCLPAAGCTRPLRGQEEEVEEAAAAAAVEKEECGPATEG